MQSLVASFAKTPDVVVAKSGNGTRDARIRFIQLLSMAVCGVAEASAARRCRSAGGLAPIEAFYPPQRDGRCAAAQDRVSVARGQYTKCSAHSHAQTVKINHKP